MTSSPSPDEARFYARSATPESPRPIHIPEPANIPVLENQIDPVFNLMTTHLPPPHASRNMTAMDHEIAIMAASEKVPSSTPAASHNENATNHSLNGDVHNEGHGQAGSQGMAELKADLDKSNATLVDNQNTSLTEQPSASMATFDESPSSVSAAIMPESQAPHHAPSPVPNPTATAEQNEHTQTSDQEGATADASNTASTNDQGNRENKESSANAGVNYQDLLDKIVPSSTVITTEVDAAPGNVAANAEAPAPSSADPPSANLASSAGLPPRPPPQEKPTIHPNYAPNEDIRSYHFPHANPASAQSSQSAQSPAASNSFRNAQFPAHLASPAIPGTGSNGLPPPPMASFQQPQKLSEQTDDPNQASPQPPRLSDANATSPSKPTPGSREDEAPWPPEIQRKYNQFLRDEEVYTSEGTWDKFPQGSRLFVGNLPTEVVTKRDIFHIFHRFGRLAQISIKQAYGFVQFMDTKDCMAAMQAEQNGKIKDRNMHLEISKPPKSSRSSGAAANNQRGSHYRGRSRSPDHGRGAASQRGGDRHARGLSFSDFRDEPRRRDDYRPGRSPSPRGFRGRDEYRGGRDRSPDRYYPRGRDQSRSPYGRGRHNRSPSPARRRSMDEDDALPFRKRDPRDVPDVQVILLDDMDPPFVQYIEKAFRDRGLRVAVLRLLPNVPLDAVVRRQILEGVVAVVQLHRAARLTGKIPLKVFDRSNDMNNVRFEEYENLDAPIAAEVASRSKQKQAAMLQNQTQYPGAMSNFGAAAPYGQPAPQTPLQQLPPQAAAAAAGQPNLANLITSLDGPALQKLLSAMQQSPQGQPSPHPSAGSAQPSPTGAPDLAALLGNVAKQPHQQQQPQGPRPNPGASLPQPGYPYGGPQQPHMPQHMGPQQHPGQYGYGAPAPFAQQSQQPAHAQQPHHQQPPQHGQPPMGYPQQPQPPGGGAGPQPSPQQVQNIMAQLARWKQ